MLNHAYFSSIDTEEKAYWLGFLFADGNLSVQKSGRKVVNLCQKDRAVLENFRAALSCQYAIGSPTKYSAKYDKIYSWHVINIYSELLFDSLFALGCRPAKSKTLLPPEGLPDSLVSHFIRGYNDGDGGIYVRRRSLRIRMRGTEEFLLWVQASLPAPSQIYPNGPTAQLFSDGKNAEENCKFLYEGATVFILRKQEVYDGFRVQRSI